MRQFISARLSYHWLLVTAFLFLFASFFYKHRSVDIHLHDTMVVLSGAHLFWIVALLFLAGWSVYRLINKFLLNRYLSLIHVLITMLVAVVFMAYALPDQPVVQPGKTDFSWKDFKADQHREAGVFLFFFILFLAGQFLFLVNLVGGFVVRIRNKGNNI